MSTRRNVILGIGGALALVGTGAAWRVTRVPTTAYRPWDEAGREEMDPRLDAFRYAVLAPNPHNLQPWKIRLIGTDEALLSSDREHRLPQTDPFDRQIVIGFGCFTEIARIAASRRGYRVEIEPFPEGADEQRLDARPVARLRFIRDAALAADPLGTFIRQRRSAKVPFDLSRPVPAGALSRVVALSDASLRFEHTRSEAEIAAIRSLATKAFALELQTPHTFRESIDVVRAGSKEIDAQPDGISLRGPMFEALSLMGGDAVRAQALAPGSSAPQQQIDRYAAMFVATPQFVWLTSKGNTRALQYASGRAYVRLNLTTTSIGLGLHPVSQALQEFPEMASLFTQARQLCRVGEGETLQMLARLGYAAPVGPTPRWPLEAKLIRT
ncbi:MAG: Acg family FMN-binding oxidoreductase [Rhabdaerophilum sp.]